MILIRFIREEKFPFSESEKFSVRPLNPETKELLFDYPSFLDIITILKMHQEGLLNKSDVSFDFLVNLEPFSGSTTLTKLSEKLTNSETDVYFCLDKYKEHPWKGFWFCNTMMVQCFKRSIYAIEHLYFKKLN